ncbi:FXYD domain-containing ion transport regulator 3-like [Protopterus annectens]|uniref:FXYD domain-containing ion transport regulator 3-like n=1 Tax=Protopterus annectens TaxID=7888 RepID=UPI001CFC1549|nr:FXYD domain-containing ion transport regulator 3-like [Protopterus annectens]
MGKVCFVLFTLLTAAAAFLPNSEKNDDPFHYDYRTLQVSGLVVAGVLCAVGIAVLLGGKCKCKQNKQRRNVSQGQQLVSSKAGSSSC